MKLCTQTHHLAEAFGHEECLRILKKNGFDAADMSFFEMVNGEGPWLKEDWREYALKIRALADELGIEFTQAHAPFPSTKQDEEFNKVTFERIVRSMEAASLLGVRDIVVHPPQHLYYHDNQEALYQYNLDFYRRLIPYCEKFNIRVCAENMWQRDKHRGFIIESVCNSPEEFCRLLDELDSPWIVGCLDIGHTALVGIEPDEFIRKMGAKRMQAMHLHDVDYLTDCHTLPFTEKLDWEAIAKALGEIGYEGNLTFEADNFIAGFPKELMPEASALMEKVGRYLISRIEAARI